MAIEATTFTPDSTIFPWADADGQADTTQPIGELMFNVKDGVIPVPGAGDSQEVRCDVTLPPNFSYVLTDLTMSLLGVGLKAADNWENLASLIYLGDVTPGSPDGIEWGLGWTSEGPTNATGLVWFHVYKNFGKIPGFQQNAGGLWQTRVQNKTVDDIGAQFQFTMRFLIYTIGQQFDAAINTPQLIR